MLRYKTILFVGRIEADKGIRIFIDAVLGALSSGVSVRAIIVGSGSLFDGETKGRSKWL